MMLVLILVAAAVILGLSYLSVASMHVAVSQNYQSLSKARYLSESGLQHALYLLRFNPQQLAGSDVTPLGPYYLNGSTDGYTISCAANAQQGSYTLTAKAVSGASSRSSSVKVYRQPAAESQIGQGLLVCNGLVSLPSSVHVTGDVHVNGLLFNSASINGNCSATLGVSDPFALVTGMAASVLTSLDTPPISANRYQNYSLGGAQHHAIVRDDTSFGPGESFCDRNGGAVSGSNAGGVVYVTPLTGSTVTLASGFHLTGTLAVNGSVVLSGSDIVIKAVGDFPAIVATGGVIVDSSARAVTITGLVVTNTGIVGQNNPTLHTITINGGLIANTTGVASGLRGTINLNYDPVRARVYDFSRTLTTQPPVAVLKWND
jgi:Tfp pilus assembly protein PilV